jgi:long-chain acyl-CoA synthetase
MTYAPRFTNLVTLLKTSCDKYQSAPLFGTRKPNGWEWTTFSEFERLVDAARAGLAALGVNAGDRVAVIANNRLEWAVCAYATYTRGAAYVPMYEAQLDPDWRHILHDSGAKACLVAGQAIEKRVRGLPDLPALQHVIDLDGPAYAELLRRGAAQPVASAQPGDDDIASIIYTSGTTGHPKGVCLSHYNLAANISALLSVAPQKEGDRCLAFLPWAHVFGGCVELGSQIAIGGSIAICDNTEKLLGYLPEVQPDLMFAVPRIWNRIYEAVRAQIAGRPKAIQMLFAIGLTAKRKLKAGQRVSRREQIALLLAERLIFKKVVARFGGKMRFAISGAAALSREVAEFIDDLGIDVYEGYGMTESSGCATANLPGARKFGSVGRAISGFTIKIDHDVVGAREGEGEIVIYGSGVMKGYYNMPEQTAACLTADGGLRSGDLGRLDADGYLFITGRVKELYKLQNGKYVAPVPLEEKVTLSPYIAQCLVYGTDQPHNVALIVADLPALHTWAQSHGVSASGAAMIDDARVRALLKDELDKLGREFKGYEAIRDFAVITDPFTAANDMLTPTLKLKRRNILAKYEAQLKALYRG